MHHWLLHVMDVSPSCMYPTSANSYLSQIVSFVQWLVAMYSASILDNAMVGCFLHFHEMIPTPTRNMYHVVDRWLFASPAQSPSQNPLKAMFLLSRHNLKSKKPFKYLVMRFITIQCIEPTFDMSWLTILTANAGSAYISFIAYIRDPTPTLYGIQSIFIYIFSNSSFEIFNNFEFTSDWVLNGLYSSMLKCLRIFSM